MARLSRFIADTGYDDLPPEVVNVVKKDILDAIAITVVGSGEEVTSPRKTEPDQR